MDRDRICSLSLKLIRLRSPRGKLWRAPAFAPCIAFGNADLASAAGHRIFSANAAATDKLPELIA